MRKLQNGQAASRKKHSSVRRPFAPPITTDLPWMSFSANDGAAVGDFKRMLFPCWRAVLHGGRIDRHGRRSRRERNQHGGINAYGYVKSLQDRLRQAREAATGRIPIPAQRL